MYEIDKLDKVIHLSGVPQSSVGAPTPYVLAVEGVAVLAYMTRVVEIWQMNREELAAKKDFRDEWALIRFAMAHAHVLGTPNDEALSGHPLAARGLQPYGAFRVENSSLIRKLERMNSVHKLHNPERYRKLQHVIFTFHDSTFECVCVSLEVKRTHGLIEEVIPEMVKLLH